MANWELEIEFDAHFGDEVKKVRICGPYYNPLMPRVYDEYFFIIDRTMLGALLKRDGSWLWIHPRPDDITVDDIQILGNMIDQGLCQKTKGPG